jgi:NADPH:quinone reductase
LTALTGLEKVLGLKSGESLIVFGASRGIGHLALQLAKRLGAKVFAIASGNDCVQLAKKLGADSAVDGHGDDVLQAAREFAPNGLDAALVTAGGEETDEALLAICQGGRIAYPHGVMPEPTAPDGVAIEAYDGENSPALIDRLNALIDSGPFEVHVDKTFRLDEPAKRTRRLLNTIWARLRCELNEDTDNLFAPVRGEMFIVLEQHDTTFSVRRSGD